MPMLITQGSSPVCAPPAGWVTVAGAMTIATTVGTAAAGAAPPPAPPPPPLAPPRPPRRLSTLRLLRVAQKNSLAACDEELFDELVVERRLLGQRCFVVSHPDGIRRVMQDNYDNYPRLTCIRRVFEFAAGSG